MRAGRVLVAQSYFLRFDPKLDRAGKPVPPLGSLICASVLRERGFEVRFFDAMLARSEDECATAMDREKPETLVLFEDNFNYLTKMCLGRMREAAVRIIGMARARGIVAIVAGSDASDDPLFFLRAGASAVAQGEGEFAVADWLSRRNVTPGIAALAADGTLAVGPPRPPALDVDSLPCPGWDLIDIEAYRQRWASRHGLFSLPLATSRGCPFHCNWCAKPIWGQRYNAMSPARAARELQALKRLGATHVNVVDDIFGLKPGWVEEFAHEARRLDAVVPFKCLSRADLLTDRTVRALSEAGCSMVWIGAESGSQKILDSMEKGTTVEETRAAAARLQALGVKVGLFLQFGYPGEDGDDVRATLRLVDEVLPDDIGVSVSYPLPGTPLFARVKDEMKRGTHWRDSSDLAMLFDGPHQTLYYRLLHANVHARLRLARALRTRNGGVPRRLLRALWHGSKRAFTDVGLLLGDPDQARVRASPRVLSRERAATSDVPVASESNEL